MKIIAIVDSIFDGHHLMYMRFFSKILLEQNFRVIIFFPKPEEIQTWINSKYPSLSDHLHCFQFHESQPSQFFFNHFRSMLTALRHWKRAKESIERVAHQIGYSPDVVFFAMLDFYTSALLPYRIVDIIFPYKWSGLYFHPWHLRIGQRFSWIRRFAFDKDSIFKSRNCRAIAVLDEGIISKLKEKAKYKTIIAFPDITDESKPDVTCSLAQDIRNKANGRRIISLLGSLERRKGLLTLIEVAKRTNFFYVFAGRFHGATFSEEELSQIREFKESAPGNCFFHFDYIVNDAKLNELFSLSDVLFAVYENFPSSSNILTKAALYRKPVLVNKKYCMGERTQIFNMGICVKNNNPDECIKAIEKLCSSDNFQPNGFSRYLQLHSYAQLNRSFKLLLSKYV